MATRFYFASTGSTPITPAFDANWEQTGQAVRRPLLYKQEAGVTTLTDFAGITVPITTTQDILCAQFISDPLRAINLIAPTWEFVVRVLESATTANVTLAIVAKFVSIDGGTVRATPLSNFNLDTEWAVTAATRQSNLTTGGTFNIQTGDRLVVEIGGHAAAPTAATTYTMRFGNSATSDFARTSGLTTDLNPWFQLTNFDFFAPVNENFKRPSAGDGISVTEITRY